MTSSPENLAAGASGKNHAQCRYLKSTGHFYSSDKVPLLFIWLKKAYLGLFAEIWKRKTTTKGGYRGKSYVLTKIKPLVKLLLVLNVLFWFDSCPSPQSCRYTAKNGHHVFEGGGAILQEGVLQNLNPTYFHAAIKREAFACWQAN